MGDHEGWSQPGGLLPNGLLPNEGASVIRVLDSERWLIAEERTAELIARIQPDKPSEERRNAVADYVQRLIMKCFPCQVFTFGSVPLKTYLPDGDIDLTAFSNNQNLKDNWASQVRDILQEEENNENAEFHVKEVQYIQAEVKIIKCLVENIVADISFNQLGGLCTLCFLEEVDHLISQNHLFKYSIILIKAWCYYESRILGAHHGLISTYALETLVLYIFHVFNNSFTGPLEVLYRFLEFFSNFDWDNFCVSLWGPVPISSLPDVTAEPPLRDSGELLLSKLFLNACSSVYAVFPGGQDNHGQPFISKHFNVIDPLRLNNNLGRSVSKGNFFRIRSAFAFGAKRLARLLDCPIENLTFEVNQFFLNTWDRHGSGHRPDAPETDSSQSALTYLDHQKGSENLVKVEKKINHYSMGHETEVEKSRGKQNISSQHGNMLLESRSKGGNASSVSHAQSYASYSNNMNSSRSSDLVERGISTKQGLHSGKNLSNSQPDDSVNNLSGRYMFARTHSSPELSDAYSEVSSHGRYNRISSGKNHISSARLDNSRIKNLGSKASVDLTSVTDSYDAGSTFCPKGEDLTSVVGIQGMRQAEQSLASTHVPFPIPASMRASLGYAQKNVASMSPQNIPIADPSWGNNMQFPQELIPLQLTHYFPGVGSTSNAESLVESGNENFGSVDLNPGNGDHEFWLEKDVDSTEGFDPDHGIVEMLPLEDKRQPVSIGINSGNSLKAEQKHAKEGRGLIRDECADSFQYQDDRGSEVNSRPRFLPSSHASSIRSKTSSESSWDGSSVKTSKSGKEKWGRKTVPLIVGDDSRDWGPINRGDQSVRRDYMPGFESARTSGLDSENPITEVILDPGIQQRARDNSSVVPFAFYPTGPPVPFLTMLPVYNFPSNKETADASTSNFQGQSFNAPEGVGCSENSSACKDRKSDILNSDFASHWQNLQYGRFCQNPQLHEPLAYPSPVAVPPMHLQGHVPWDGPGRPVSTNINFFTQVMGGPRVVPVAPLQSIPDRPAGVYQSYVDEMPRYRSGTGTYLPNPKVSTRDRPAPSSRRGSYNYDRNDRPGDREGNWNTNNKPRAIARNHSRSHGERPSHRFDREGRSSRPWGSHRHESFPPLRSNSTTNASSSMAHGTYPAQAMDTGGAGRNVPPVVMIYPYDHNSGYTGMNEASTEEQSPPSTPHIQGGI